MFILTMVATAFVVLGLAAGAYGLVRSSSYKLVQVTAESMTNTGLRGHQRRRRPSARR